MTSEFYTRQRYKKVKYVEHTHSLFMLRTASNQSQANSEMLLFHTNYFNFTVNYTVIITSRPNLRAL